ncbi:MAG: DUF1684 domain-containing protein [Thermoanaerobaculum sp.]
MGRARVFVLLAVALAACAAPLPEGERRWREGREAAIREAMTPEQAKGFPGIRFFPYDPAYKVKALLVPVVPPEPVAIAASDGSVRPAHRVGRVEVSLPAGRATLTVFQLDDIRDRYPDHLFLPFRDSLAGKETYGSGRYLELTRLPSGVVELDFNRAYNPDCAYGLTGRCPITPEENWLSFPVPAGEKLPHGVAHP